MRLFLQAVSALRVLSVTLAGLQMHTIFAEIQCSPNAMVGIVHEMTLET